MFIGLLFKLFKWTLLIGGSILVLAFIFGEKSAEPIAIEPYSGPVPGTSLLPKENLLIGLDFNKPQQVVADLETYGEKGADLYELFLNWNEIETRPGEYDFKWAGVASQLIEPGGYTLVYIIKPVDTNVAALPDDLQGKPFNDPEVIQRFQTLLTEFFQHVGNRADYVFISNESDRYFASKPGEFAAYLEFFEAAADHIKTISSETAIGSSVTFEGIEQMPQMVRDLNQYTDVFALTYYPIQSHDQIKSAEDLQKIKHIAGGKKIFFQEVGYPSSPDIGSSEKKQADFYADFFQTVAANSGQITALRINTLYDNTNNQCNEWLDYYGIHTREFKALLCSLGLVTEDGREKAAHQVFKSALGN